MSRFLRSVAVISGCMVGVMLYWYWMHKSAVWI